MSSPLEPLLLRPLWCRLPYHLSRIHGHWATGGYWQQDDIHLRHSHAGHVQPGEASEGRGLCEEPGLSNRDVQKWSCPHAGDG